jgi:hypothetical protein
LCVSTSSFISLLYLFLSFFLLLLSLRDSVLLLFITAIVITFAVLNLTV